MAAPRVHREIETRAVVGQRELENIVANAHDEVKLIASGVANRVGGNLLDGEVEFFAEVLREMQVRDFEGDFPDYPKAAFTAKPLEVGANILDESFKGVVIRMKGPDDSSDGLVQILGCLDNLGG